MMSTTVFPYEVQMNRLKSKYTHCWFKPLESHRGDDGIELPCCLAAKMYLRCMVTSSANFGLAGILEFLRGNFKWGLYDCNTFCCCLKKSCDLSCDSNMLLAIEVINFFSTIVTSPKLSFSLMSVEGIVDFLLPFILN